MLGSPVANHDSFVVSTPSDAEIQITRLFNAPRELVFDAMTQPEHVRQWWGQLGEGYSVPACTIDLRVDYLRPGIGERFELSAEVIRIGSRVASARMEFRGEDGTLLSTGTAAYIVS